MKLTIAGCGDAFGSGGRFNTCYHVQTSTGTFLLDCGASSMIALNRCRLDPNEIDTIFLTHLHGDHFCGLPFVFLHAWYVSGRSRDLTIAGPPGTEARVRAALQIMYPDAEPAHTAFAIRYVVIEPGAPRSINDVEVEAFPVQHYSGAPAYALRCMADGRTLTFSGDTEWVDTLYDAAANADIFLIECYTYDLELNLHSNYLNLAKHLKKVTAKRILLTHMSEDMLAKTDRVAYDTVADGNVYTL